MKKLCFLFAAVMAVMSVDLVAQEGIKGEQLEPPHIGEGYIESLQAAIDRDATIKDRSGTKERQGRQGTWAVPNRRASYNPLSGEHYAVNKWGDTRMGIGFPGRVVVHGAYFKGQSNQAVWTTGIKAIGYRNGEAVHETDWFRNITVEPQWMEMEFYDVDRIEILSVPVANGGGFYGMDDLAYTPCNSAGVPEGDKVVVNFDDLSFRTKLTGSGYAGLNWETGSGDFDQADAVHQPEIPPDIQIQKSQGTTLPPSMAAGTAPTLLNKYQGVIRGDAGSASYPPDTDGAVGPDHFVITVNRNFAVYDKYTGAEQVNILLGAFLPNSNGDPRIVFDQHSQRWIVHVTDFSATATIFLAVSLTDDPTGDWYKTSFLTAVGADAGKWPDYPTLGVDEDGIYIAAYMVGSSSGMTIWAVDKAPLVATPPSMGTVTAWRGLLWEGAIQPAHTYGTGSGEYLVSWKSSSSLRLRRIDGPMTSPTMVEAGTVTVPSFSDPVEAPALGSPAINTVDDRLMMSVFRDGSLWTAHTITVGSKAACRWYEIDAASATLIQSGNVTDTSLHFYFPSIMVNKYGDVVMGFSGSDSSQYPGCYFTGRLATDPPGEMAVPQMYKEGESAYDLQDSYGRNRWGDYSYTTLDPSDETTFWTLQEYSEEDPADATWATYMAVLVMEEPALSLQLSSTIPQFQYPGLGYTAIVEIADGAESYVPGSGKLHYRYDGGTFQEISLVAMGNDIYQADLPATVPGDMPEFYFSADGNGGTSLTLPKNAPADFYFFDVYFKQLVFVDDFETNTGWTVESTNLDTGEWERADPQGTDAQPENDHSASGTMCFVTGSLAGSGIGSYDVDGGPTRLISPAIDLSGGDAVVEYYLWFYHSTGGGQQPLEVHVSNNNGGTWTKVADVSNNPAWVFHSFKVSDYVTPTAQVKVRFSANDNPNDNIVEALVDDFSVVRIVDDATLWADDYDISAAMGGLVDFSLDAGAANANRKYLLLGSVTGTSPGLPLPGGQVVLPLNWDIFSDIIMMGLGSPIFQNFLGNLDGQGQATATLMAIGPFDPALVGAELFFAYPLSFPPSWNFASNPVVITMVD